MEFEPIPIKKKNHNKKPLMLVLTIIMFLGVSFAAVYYVNNQSDTRVNKLVSELIDIVFTKQSENIYLSEDKAVPMLDALGKQNTPYEFTVKNTSKVPIRVYISLNIKSISINKSALRFALYIDDEEVITSDLSKLDKDNNLYIVDNLDANASIKCKLVFWIDYYYEAVNQSFDATIKVTGESKDYIADSSSEPEPEIPTTGVATEVLKAKLGTDGLIGVTNNNTMTKSSDDEIREYRYSGSEVNNYAYFNCQDEKEKNGDNCEIWRIIGIFKGEDGQDHLKIVKNEVLSIGDKNWASSSPYSNNWEGSDINTYLNGTYLQTLASNAQGMIEETKYYLGNIENSLIKDFYDQERGNASCNGSCKGGDIWEGNSAIWSGSIALMYPSDYGFSTDSTAWGLSSSDSNNFSTSWLNTTTDHSNYEWFLSPSASLSSSVTSWRNSGDVGSNIASGSIRVRPTLYLKSNVKISTSNETNNGTSVTPYILVY